MWALPSQYDSSFLVSLPDVFYGELSSLLQGVEWCIVDDSIVVLEAEEAREIVSPTPEAVDL